MKYLSNQTPINHIILDEIPVEDADGALESLGGVRRGVPLVIVGYVPRDGFAGRLCLQQSEDCRYGLV